MENLSILTDLTPPMAGLIFSIYLLCYFLYMETISELLPYAQVVLSILLIGAIILQQTGSSLGGAFGGDNFSAGFHKRRGFEKLLFNATIVIAVLFAITAFLALII